MKTSEARLTWIESAEDLQEAKKCLITLASSKRGDYFILDLSEHKFIEQLEESA
jgi:hypothetical protein